jgi:hypothetical protein
LVDWIPVASSGGIPILRGIGVPEGGEVGDIIVRTEASTEWAAPNIGPGGVVTAYTVITGFADPEDDPRYELMPNGTVWHYVPGWPT